MFSLARSLYRIHAVRRARQAARAMRAVRASRAITNPANFSDLRVSVPSFDSFEDVQVVRRGVRRPSRFHALEVVVPTETERHDLPDLPAKALEVYPGLPTADDWGALERTALARLEHLRIVDTCAYKASLAAGVRAPPPPTMRA